MKYKWADLFPHNQEAIRKIHTNKTDKELLDFLWEDTIDGWIGTRFMGTDSKMKYEFNELLPANQEKIRNNHTSLKDEQLAKFDWSWDGNNWNGKMPEEKQPCMKTVYSSPQDFTLLSREDKESIRRKFPKFTEEDLRLTDWKWSVVTGWVEEKFPNFEDFSDETRQEIRNLYPNLSEETRYTVVWERFEDTWRGEGVPDSERAEIYFEFQDLTKEDQQKILEINAGATVEDCSAYLWKWDKNQKLRKGDKKQDKPAGFASQVLNIVTSRGSTYGTPSENHQTTADLWSAWLTRKFKTPTVITAEDVCLLNILQKVSRLASKTKDDSLLDIAGYVENIGMLKTEQRNK